ncbi:MAG: chemotaxis protein CheB [Planctomycetaceae bacterium]|nr:chemotaxis protein CheB [Planctomycetaceae bacterium]
MANHEIIVIGASAGGVEALAALVQGLPADLPASLFVVLHLGPHSASVLPQILSQKGTLPARHARDGEAIEPGRIYVASPDRHLLVRHGRVRVSLGPKENSLRPAADPLFRSAAQAYGRRVVGVVLSGTLDDGTAGLQAIKSRGGVTIVQDPRDALFAGMPRSALEGVTIDHCLPITEIAPLLVRLAYEPVKGGGEQPMSDEYEKEAEIAEFDLAVIQDDAQRPGVPSGFACPDCGGALWELHEGELIRYRCRVGHAWSPSSLLAEQSEALESALWTALRALEERAALSERVAERFALRGHTRPTERFREQAAESRRRAALIRQVLLNGEPEAETAAGTPAEAEAANLKDGADEPAPRGEAGPERPPGVESSG